MRVVLLADTHLPDGSGRSLDERVLRSVSDSDLVLHAGDVTGRELLESLGRRAPVRAVLGNNDRDLVGLLPDELKVDLEGVTVVVVHDAGPRKGRVSRLARRHPDADLVVFGHSHLPEDLAPETGPRIFNPGSATQRRRAPTRTFGLLDIAEGRIAGLAHVHLD